MTSVCFVALVFLWRWLPSFSSGVRRCTTRTWATLGPRIGACWSRCGCRSHRATTCRPRTCATPWPPHSTRRRWPSASSKLTTVALTRVRPPSPMAPSSRRPIFWFSCASERSFVECFCAPCVSCLNVYPSKTGFYLTVHHHFHSCRARLRRVV